MSFDEVIVFLGSLVTGGLGATNWYKSLSRSALLGCPRYQRLPLYLTPIVCLFFLWIALIKSSAIEVRSDTSYIYLFLFLGTAWMFLSIKVFSVLGISFQDDAVENHNSAAVIAICGALLGIMFTFIGSNRGEGATIWMTIFPALIAAGLFYLLWFILEVSSRFTNAIVEDRDPASGIRFAGYCICTGLILGRAAAGDWHSWSETWWDFLKIGSPCIFLLSIAALLNHRFRPTPQLLFPSTKTHGVIPVIGFFVFTFLYLFLLAIEVKK
jgi:uncharacterized membrane protein YjfL (UPF0719 family)